jgi:hypothetical protein
MLAYLNLNDIKLNLLTWRYYDSIMCILYNNFDAITIGKKYILRNQFGFCLNTGRIHIPYTSSKILIISNSMRRIYNLHVKFKFGRSSYIWDTTNTKQNNKKLNSNETVIYNSWSEFYLSHVYIEICKTQHIKHANQIGNNLNNTFWVFL